MYVFHGKSMPRSCLRMLHNCLVSRRGSVVASIPAISSVYWNSADLCPPQAFQSTQVTFSPSAFPTVPSPFPDDVLLTQTFVTVLKNASSFTTNSGNTLPIALLYTAGSPAYGNDLVFSPNLVASTRSKMLT
jgi:hypothetical protein